MKNTTELTINDLAIICDALATAKVAANTDFWSSEYLPCDYMDVMKKVMSLKIDVELKKKFHGDDVSECVNIH